MIVFVAFALMLSIIPFLGKFYVRPYITGLALEQIANSSCPCIDGTPANTCVEGDPPWYCNEVEPGVCEIQVACTICGCPNATPVCNPNTGISGLGTCTEEVFPYCGDGDCQANEDCNWCPEDCGECSVVGVVDNDCGDVDNGECSSTQPLYCDEGELINDCGICGCPNGYYCEDNGLCLINNSEVDNESIVGLDAILWERVRERVIGEVPIEEEGINEGFEKRDILSSPENFYSRVVPIKEIDDVANISKKSVEETKEKIANIEKLVVEKNPEKLQESLGDAGKVISGEAVKGVLEEAVRIREQVEIPEFSPEVRECVSEVNGSCIGFNECCEGLVCAAGQCVNNDGGIGVEFRIPMEESNIVSEEELIMLNEGGYSDLVGVELGENASSDELRVVKYVARPNFVRSLDIPNAVDFGFYDINIDGESIAKLSFKIKNDLLVLNQIRKVGLYRYDDGKWNSLDLVNVKYLDGETLFEFETPGFSYFNLIGEKDLPDVSSTINSNETKPLWAIYKVSRFGGVSLVEILFDNQDKLIFGRMFSQPFIDLEFNSL